MHVLRLSFNWTRGSAVTQGPLWYKSAVRKGGEVKPALFNRFKKYALWYSYRNDLLSASSAEIKITFYRQKLFPRVCHELSVMAMHRSCLWRSWTPVKSQRAGEAYITLTNTTEKKAACVTATGSVHRKFGEIWTCDIWVFLRYTTRQTDRQTNRQTNKHTDTLITIHRTEEKDRSTTKYTFEVRIGKNSVMF